MVIKMTILDDCDKTLTTMLWVPADTNSSFLMSDSRTLLSLPLPDQTHQPRFVPYFVDHENEES